MFSFAAPVQLSDRYHATSRPDILDRIHGGLEQPYSTLPDALGDLHLDTCKSIVALSLGTIYEPRRRSRRGKGKAGLIQDPFSHWRVLSIDSCPPLHASSDFDLERPWFNGPEAFLVMIEVEIGTARKRLLALSQAVSRMAGIPVSLARLSLLSNCSRGG